MKTRVITLASLLFSACCIFFTNCQKDSSKPFESDSLNLPVTPFDYLSSVQSAGLQTKTITNDIATLGRVLFYDKTLSINNTIACASCHKQEFGFADNKAFSEGFKGEMTSRNSLSAANIGNSRTLFWDMRTTSLEDLVLQPIANHIEMGLDNTDNLIKKLNRTDYYPELFRKAYGTTDIDTKRVSQAITAFLKAMNSRKSRFDESQKGNWGILTTSEQNGWHLFTNQLHCTGCHNGPNFSSEFGGAFNIGLDINYKDNGIGARSGEATMNGAFKAPTLRNIGLTAPYMHDGRFNTLEEVVEHYNSNVQNHVNLSNFLRGFAWGGNSEGVFINNGFGSNCWNCGVGKNGDDFKPLKMTTQQRADLVAFLKTLTDDSFKSDTKFSNPFQ
jgi:cytochrome c peroxidase